MQTTGGRSLRTTLAAFNPGYRRVRVLLVVLAVVAGVILFAENSALEALSIAFRKDVSVHRAIIQAGGWRGTLAQIAVRAHQLGWSRPLLMLILFVGLRLGRIGTDLWGRLLLSRMQIQSRGEVEREVLLHLQRQGDEFFGSRPLGEILNRLSADVDRALEARDASSRLFRLLVMICGNLYFFILQDWRLALVGVFSCVAGAAWMNSAAWPIARTEKELLERDDSVRSHFEDVLRAAPEVQVGNLFGQARDYMGGAQGARERVFNRVAWLEARLIAVQGTAALLGMAALFLVTLYFLAAQNPEAGVALVPIILKALPELFTNSSAVVLQRLSLLRSNSSIQRLLEFDSPLDSDEHTSTPVPQLAKLTFDDVTYQYPTPSGVAQGGVQGVSTELTPGRWIAVVGATGAGKSTFLQLLLGRLQPQEGAVRYGTSDLRRLTPEQRAEVLSLMPQRLLVLDASIRANITFGRAETDTTPLPASDLAVLEAAGLADVCRVKALTMLPTPAELEGPLGRSILKVRSEAWAGLSRLGVEFRRYGRDVVDPQHWVLEHLLQSRSDRARAVGQLTEPAARRPMRRIHGTSLGGALLWHGQQTLLASRRLLRLGTYQAFVRIAPFYLDEKSWQLWTAALPFAEASDTSDAEAAMLMSVALTSPANDAAHWQPRPEWAAGIAVLKGLFDSVCRPFDAERVHPYLTWRENLLFASVDVRNDRVEARLEQLLLELVESQGLTSELIQVGLGFQVGRSGMRLSGGQGQLVALCRTLMRGTPVVVLDEPTSALDPNSRARVAALLQAWKKDRIVITTSHDPELIRQADEIRLFERGRLVRAGSYDDLVRESATLRRILRIEAGPASGIRMKVS